MTYAFSDFDTATYYGDEDDGVYVNIGQGPDDKWYMTASVDCNTAHFTDYLVTDDGPYDTRGEAEAAGRDAAIRWCIDNDVTWDTGSEET